MIAQTLSTLGSSPRTRTSRQPRLTRKRYLARPHRLKAPGEDSEPPAEVGSSALVTEPKDEYRFRTASDGPGDRTPPAFTNRQATALPLLSAQGSVGIAVLP